MNIANLVRRCLAVFVVFTSLFFVTGHSKSAAASGGPHLFSSARTIEKAWSPDLTLYKDHRRHCFGGLYPQQNDSCNYLAHGIFVGVQYINGRATHFGLPTYNPDDHRGNKQPSSGRYWAFLTSLIPPGAKQYACRIISPSANGGPVRVCLYHYPLRFPKGTAPRKGNTFLIAQYLNPNNLADNADMEIDTLNLGFDIVRP